MKFTWSNQEIFRQPGLPKETAPGIAPGKFSGGKITWFTQGLIYFVYAAS